MNMFKFRKLTAVVTALAFFAGPFCVNASSPTQTGPTISDALQTSSVAITSGAASVLAGADTALARRSFSRGAVNQAKGEVAERLAEEVFESQPVDAREWRTLRPRFGRNGFDGLLGELDETGRPAELLEREIKYGTSRLGMTADGIQFGMRWSTRRLQAMAGRYAEVADEVADGSVRMTPRPKGLRVDTMPIPMKDATPVYWRERSTDAWKLDSDGESKDAIELQTRLWARLHEETANGSIPVAKQLVQCVPENAGLEWVVRDGENLNEVGSSIGNLPVLGRAFTPFQKAILERVRNLSSGQVAAALRRQLPYLSDVDSREMASAATASLKNLDDLSEMPTETLATSFVPASFLIGGIAAVGDPVFRLLAGERNSSRLLRGAVASGVVVTGAAAAGQMVTIAILRSPDLYGVATGAAEQLGFRGATVLARGVGAFTTMGITAIALPYAEYELGLIDATEANREALAGGIGVGAAAGTAALAWSLVLAYGTASTDTAIATLNGAAASSAGLAWLGGGSLAAGGFGVAGGTALAATGVGLIVIAVSGATLVAYRISNDG